MQSLQLKGGRKQISGERAGRSALGDPAGVAVLWLERAGGKRVMSREYQLLLRRCEAFSMPNIIKSETIVCS